MKLLDWLSTKRPFQNSLASREGVLLSGGVADILGSRQEQLQFCDAARRNTVQEMSNYPFLGLLRSQMATGKRGDLARMSADVGRGLGQMWGPASVFCFFLPLSSLFSHARQRWEPPVRKVSAVEL